MGTILCRHLYCKSFPVDIIAILKKFHLKHFTELLWNFVRWFPDIRNMNFAKFHEISFLIFLCLLSLPSCLFISFPSCLLLIFLISLLLVQGVKDQLILGRLLLQEVLSLGVLYCTHCLLVHCHLVPWILMGSWQSHVVRDCVEPVRLKVPIHSLTLQSSTKSMEVFMNVSLVGKNPSLSKGLPSR